MQMMMKMATRSFKSTSGSVSVALVVVLVAVMVAETSAQFVSITFVNELDAPVTVLGAPGSSVSITIAPRSDETVQVSPQDSVLDSSFDLQVHDCVYSSAGSVQGRVVSNTGTLKIYLTGHCGTEVPGLQVVTSVDGDVCSSLGCAAPVNPACTGPLN